MEQNQTMKTQTITLTLNEILTLKCIINVEINENNKQINKLKQKNDKTDNIFIDILKEDNETLKRILNELE
jgi:hypothetical protein